MSDKSKRLKIIITGSTGMVGEGVLMECFANERVEKVLVINRRPCGFSHGKLEEIIHPDFLSLGAIENKLKAHDACFFCAGVSSVGMKEAEYYRLTYTLTMGFAEAFSRQNPGATFCYVTGAGTDSTEKGRIMWARVKGKTENDLMKLNLDVYNFRPALMIPEKKANNSPRAFRYLTGLLRLLEKIMPGFICNLDLVGKAMINVSLKPVKDKILEVKDIRRLAVTS